MPSDEVIIFGGLAVFLLSIGIGVIGILGVYGAYPELTGLPEPTCECPKIQDEYDDGRQKASALGFLIGTPLILGWWIISRIGTAKEIENGS